MAAPTYTQFAAQFVSLVAATSPTPDDQEWINTTLATAYDIHPLTVWKTEARRTQAALLEGAHRFALEKGLTGYGGASEKAGVRLSAATGQWSASYPDPMRLALASMQQGGAEWWQLTRYGSEHQQLLRQGYQPPGIF